jgi:hypothetical protein
MNPIVPCERPRSLSLHVWPFPSRNKSLVTDRAGQGNDDSRGEWEVQNLVGGVRGDGCLFALGTGWGWDWGWTGEWWCWGIEVGGGGRIWGWKAVRAATDDGWTGSQKVDVGGRVDDEGRHAIVGLEVGYGGALARTHRAELRVETKQVQWILSRAAA